MKASSRVKGPLFKIETKTGAPIFKQFLRQSYIDQFSDFEDIPHVRQIPTMN